MNRALWLLLGLRIRAWFRRIGSNLRTVRGILLTVVVGLLMLFWFGTVLWQAIIVSQKPQATAASGWVERFGPFLLLLYCAWSVIGSPSQSPVNFTLPEVQFLFAGPFSRRQVLTYKLVSQGLLTLPLSLFISIAARSMMGTWLGGWLGTLLLLNFVQLFTAAFSLLAHAIEERAYTRVRQVVLWGILLALISSVTYAWWAAGGLDDPSAVLVRWESSPALQYGLMPLRWFFRVIAAREHNALFWGYVLSAVAVDVGLFLMVMRLDGHYLETAAKVAERRAAALERLRSGGLANTGGVASAETTSRRRRVPTPPWLFGVGPIVWRQMLGAVRSHRVLFVLAVATLVALAGPLIAMSSSGKADSPAMPHTLAAIGLVMSIMLSQIVAFDFRADLDRIELLKTLPLSPWQIAAAEVLTPALILSVFQIGLTGIIYAVFGGIHLLFAIVIVLSWPLNFMLMGVENGLFLLYPTRMAPAAPGDFSHAFRQMLTMMAKMLVLGLGVLIGAVAGAIGLLVSAGSFVVAVLVAAVPIVLLALATIPFVAWAFARFDVSRDMPP